MSVIGAFVGSLIGGAVGWMTGSKSGATWGAVGGALAGHLLTGSDDADAEGDSMAAEQPDSSTDTSGQPSTGSVRDDQQLALLEPTTRALAVPFVIAAKQAGFMIYVNNTKRSRATQKVLWNDYVARGKTPPAVSNPDKSPSAHLFAAALDVDFLDDAGNHIHSGDIEDSVWRELADLGRKMGLVAGYYFKTQKDVVHFERPDWRTLRDQQVNS